MLGGRVNMLIEICFDRFCPYGSFLIFYKYISNKDVVIQRAGEKGQREGSMGLERV